MYAWWYGMSKSQCTWLHQHTCQEELEKWQELHSVRLQYMIQLLELQCSVNGENEWTGTFWEQLVAENLKAYQ